MRYLCMPRSGTMIGIAHSRSRIHNCTGEDRPAEGSERGEETHVSPQKNSACVNNLAAEFSSRFVRSGLCVCAAGQADRIQSFDDHDSPTHLKWGSECSERVLGSVIQSCKFAMLWSTLTRAGLGSHFFFAAKIMFINIGYRGLWLCWRSSSDL